MSARTLVLASASPARLGLLLAAGFSPVVEVSGVDEDGVDENDTRGATAELAARKASAVARTGGGRLVLGCDSMLEFDGRGHGKPTDAEEARQWLVAMRGRSATLWTGHHLIDEDGHYATEVVGTTVHFGVMTDAELDIYLSDPLVLNVAGAFTLDGRSAPFVDGIDGDYSNVIGLSLPALRRLLTQLNLSVTDLWTGLPSSAGASR